MTEDKFDELHATAERELKDEYERVTGKWAADDILVICQQAAHMAIHSPFMWSRKGDLYFYGKKFDGVFV